MALSSRYVPHSDDTKEHYEQLLLDVSRCLPPGVYDDLEEITEEVLAIVCSRDKGSGHGSEAEIYDQQVRLERLLGTSLQRGTLDKLLRYGRLLTDYVPADATVSALEGAGATDANEREAAGGVQDGLVFDTEGPSSSTDGDDSDTDEIALLTGTLPRRRQEKKAKKKSLRADKSLSQFAFEGGMGGVEEGQNIGGRFPFDLAPGDAEMESEDLDGAFETPAITFDEVACNPQYIIHTLRRLFPSQTPTECEAQAGRVVAYLSERAIDNYELETRLTAFLGGYDDDEVQKWIGDLRSSRWGIVYGLRYAACETQKKKQAIMEGMREHALQDPVVEHLYESLTGKEVDFVQAGKSSRAGAAHEEAAESGNAGSTTRRERPLRSVDLQACAFSDESAPHRHARVTVPHGTQRLVYETHDELVLPPTAARDRRAVENLLPLSAFPAWCHEAFPGISHLNPMQSQVFDCAFNSDENMLICAPTGAGKTNIAMMAMLRLVQQSIRGTSDADEVPRLHVHELKMVYIAPMKALVQEVVRNFSERLAPLGLTVAELSGDSAMTQRQLQDVQLIVATPEKWDIVTRKSVDLGVASLLRMIILDEVHLLHNERGPVLEAIVARTILQQQLRGSAGIRLVGLSATLPNYEDVAAFLQVDQRRGLFNFDSSFRPVPLQQSFCAAKRLRGVNQAVVLNRIVYDKVLEAAQDNEQVMIFVHSRRETEHTAMALKNRALEERHQNFFCRPGTPAERELHDAAEAPHNSLRHSIRQLLPHGFAIHHAGLSREERRVTEELFADRHIKVLVCTSTLAWGVNLPANRVIIKGTRVFNATKGESVRLSALDVLQMFGRAGRVGFGASLGHATILTTPEDLSYYLGLINQQLPIESQMMRRVVDMLNAQIALGHVENTKEGVRWLQRSYLYIRMLKAPELYGTRPNPSDPLLTYHLENIIHTACEELASARMVDYDKSTRRVGPTPYGRIASHCYVSTASMQAYLSNLTRAMQEPNLFRVFSLSNEFASLTVRAEEQAQLKDLLDTVPIAVHESRYTPLAKINVLLQCYISRKTLEGLPLMSEMVYVRDSAQRILRALYEICLVREFGRTARQYLELYAMVLHQQWHVESPARQVVGGAFGLNAMESILPVLERFRVPWEELRRWSLEDLIEKLGDERRAAMVHSCITQVPHYTLEVGVRPLTRSMLYVDIDLTPDFVYNETLHGRGPAEVLLTVEHTNSRILHHEMLQLPLACLRSGETYAVPPIVVPMVEPRPTHLFVHCVCPQWLASGASAAVCLMNMQLPAMAPALREVDTHTRTAEDAEELDVRHVLAPYKLGEIGDQLFPFSTFYASQRELVASIFDLDSDNLFAGVPPGGGKTVLAELFILKHLLDGALLSEQELTAEADASATNPTGRNAKKREQDEEAATIARQAPAALPRRKVLYLTAHRDTARRRYMDWRYRFGERLQQPVVLLDPERIFQEAAVSLSNAAIVIATGSSLLAHVQAGAAWLRGVTHLIADHLHLLRSPEGRFTERCLARLQSSPFLVQRGTGRARLLALSYPLISALELARWLRIPASGQFNFGTTYRQLRVRLEGLDQPNTRARYEASVVATLKLLERAPYQATSALLFVPHAAAAASVAGQILLRCRSFALGESAWVVGKPAADGDVGPVELEDRRLARLLAAGVAYVHAGTSTLDLLTVLEQLEEGGVRHPTTQQSLPLILVCTFEAAWRLPAAAFANVFVVSAERTLARADTHGGPDHVELSVTELLQMTSRASHEAVVFGRTSRRWVWGQLLNGPLPLESHAHYPADFSDAVNAAIATRRASTPAEVLRILQSHYFLYHLKSNPHFYAVPSADDLPLFASDLADRVVQGLQEHGCVRVVEAEEGVSALWPTARGLALAHHGFSAQSMVALFEAAAEARNRHAGNKHAASASAAHLTGAALSLTTWLSLLARHCEELSPARLGDAARVLDAAELRALHTIARALPPHFAVRYIDLDFSAAGTKVLLLCLAHCARFFGSTELATKGDAAEVGGSANVPAHPFASACQAVSAADHALLCSLDRNLVEGLAESLAVLRPVVVAAVGAVVELFDGVAQGEADVAQLQLLAECLCTGVWDGEDPLWQLPTVRREGLGSLQAAAGGFSLAALQRKSLAGPAESWSSGMQPNEAASSTAVGRVLALVAEAQAVPRVESFSARGTMEEVDGLGITTVVEVCGFIWWAPPGPGAARDKADQESEEPAAAWRWWLSCAVRPKLGTAGAGVTSPTGVQNGAVLALRVSSLVRCTPADLSTEGEKGAVLFELRGRLFFPLRALEEAGDLDAIDLVAACVSTSYYAVRAETVVLFDTTE